MNKYKVVHFSDEFTIEDINNVMSSKEGVLYFTRYIPEKNEFHIVNHKKGEFTITPFVTQIFNFYNNNKNLSGLVKESKVKGNETFAIITNVRENLLTQLKKDLNTLLKK
ncbi:MAG: hypothetical protein ACOCVF_03740 [bacterium]